MHVVYVLLDAEDDHPEAPDAIALSSSVITIAPTPAA
jgi:hypothetical protein